MRIPLQNFFYSIFSLRRYWLLVCFSVVTVCLFANPVNSSLPGDTWGPTSTTLISSASPSCFGSAITLTATVTPATATGIVEFYDGALLLGAGLLSAGTATLNTGTLLPGSHSLTATYVGDIFNTGSTSPVLTQSIDAATPATPGTISGATPVCPATSQTYSVTGVTNATIYNWTLPAGWVIDAGAGTNSITVTTTTSAGNVSVSAGNSCGTSAASSKAVTTNPPIPAVPGPISGLISVCPSTPGNIYSIAAVPGAINYTWTSPGTGWTGTSTTTSITYATLGTAVSGNISVAANNGCGSSGTPTTINLNPVNAPGNSGYTDGLTKFDDGITVANSTTASERYGYLKFPTTSLSVIPGGSTITSVLNLRNLSTTSTNNSVNALGTNDPVTTPAGTLFSAAPVGANYSTLGWTSGALSLPLKPQANLDIASSISSPGYIAMALLRPITGSSVVNFSGYSAGANAPVLAVTYASLRQLAVTVRPPIPVAPGAIAGPAAVCPNSTGNIYSISTVANATSYIWTLPAGWVITAGAGTESITVTANTTPGNITVKGTNSCGTGPAGPTKAVSIGVLPTVSATPASQEICSGTAIGTITATNPNAVAGTTYSWSRDNLATTGMAYLGTTTGAITGNITNALTTQQITNFTIYAVSGIGCSSALPVVVSVAINVNPAANAGADQPGCSGTPVAIGGTPTASGGTPGYSYLWTAGVSNTTIANPTATPGTYTVTVTDSKGCVATDAVTVSSSTGAKNWIGSGSVAGGGVDANFNNPANWSPNGVPGACNDVTINCDIFNIFNLFSGALVISMNASATIKSLSIDIGGTVVVSSATFKLFTGSNNTLNILNSTLLNTHTASFLGPVVGSFISVGPGSVITYGGPLTTITSNGCLNYPFYADVNGTGKMYLYGNAALAGIGNDPGNKPGQIIFNGTGTQTISNNSGTQPIYLAADRTNVGETNSPTVVLAGSGTNGFRNIGDLYINNAATLDLGTTQSMNRNSAGGAINMAAGTFMKVGRTTGGVGSSNFPSNFSTFTFNATSTVNYNAAGNQTVFTTPLYGNLTLSSSGTKTISANVTAQKNIDIQGASTFVAGGNTITLGGNWTNYGQAGFNEQTSMVDFNGTGAQTISTAGGGEIFHGLRKTNTGTTTMLSDVAVQGTAPSFRLSAGTFDAGSFSFNSSAGTLNISNGLLKLARTGATILPEFLIAPYSITGGTIELYGSGDQQLRGLRAYSNLTFSNTGIKTVSSAITSILGTVLTQNSVTLDVSNNTMGGAGTSLTMTGTSLYKTAGVGTKPDAQGTYSLGAGTTIEFTNTAATTEDVRLTAPTYYNVVVSGNNVANPSAGTGIKFQAGGTFTVKNGGLFKPGNSAGFSGGSATSIANTNNPSIVLENGSTIEYYGGTLGTTAQAITNVIPYYSLGFSGTSVKTAPASTLTVKGNLYNNNSAFAHNNGIVLLNGVSAQNYNSTGTTLNYYDLTAANNVNVNINGDLGIERLLSLGLTGKINMVTGNISLRSTSARTAAVDKISLPNSITYTGSGRFNVERYIPSGISHLKTWQFLSTPAFGESLNATLQEGNGALVPGTAGLGTTISSEVAGAFGRGYDFVTPSGPSIKTFNSITNTWIGIDDGLTPTVSVPFDNPKGYMLFVRGDRYVQSSATTANKTTLRSKGKLYAPGTDAPLSLAVAANSFGSVGNPYASAIDFTNLRAGSPGIDDKYYVWDPSLPGSQGLGGYQVFSGISGWLATPGGTLNYPGGANTSIQSGQAFFVYATPGGTVNFNENNKITGSQMVYRNANFNERPFFRAYLYGANGYLADGNVVATDLAFANAFDENDALKMQNTSENFGISNAEKVLTIDARQPFADNDTISYVTTGLRAQNYVLKFAPSNMEAAGVSAFLVDRFENTTSRISLADSSIIDFDVTADPASASPGRFFIVFKALAPVPVTFLNIEAKRNTDQSVKVNWKVANETNLTGYQLERSNDGRHFSKVDKTFPVLNNGGGAAYSFNDEEAFISDNFYRVKAIGNGNYNIYSPIAKVAGIEIKKGISVYPNPVADRILHVHFNHVDAGTYNFLILNAGGQTVYNNTATIEGNEHEVKDIPIGNSMASGSYQLNISGPGVSKHVIQILIK